MEPSSVIPRFICDEMLHGLGRWLRAAGYDTVVATPGAMDRSLIELALKEERTLITRDRKMIEIRNADRVVLLLLTNGLDDCIKELTEKLQLDWLHKPFSRCMRCNTPLQRAEPALRNRVPADILEDNDALLYCPDCDKVYWWGSHVDRMQRKLEGFNGDGGLPAVQ